MWQPSKRTWIWWMIGRQEAWAEFCQTAHDANLLILKTVNSQTSENQPSTNGRNLRHSLVVDLVWPTSSAGRCC